MKQRLLVAAVGVPLLIVVLVLLPPIATAILTAAIAGAAAWELLEPFLQCLPSNLSIFTTYPCMFSDCLGAIPADYVDRGGGERLPVITTVDELAAILKNG